MSYDKYREWVKSMDPMELQQELNKVQAARMNSKDARAKAAWYRMEEIVLREMNVAR